MPITHHDSTQIALRSAGRRGPFGDPFLGLLDDPVASFDRLASRRADRESSTLALAPFARNDADLRTHVQGLACFRDDLGRRCLALCRSGISRGGLAFLADDGHGYRLQTHTTTALDHPSGIAAWDMLLAVACEANESAKPASVLLFDNPVVPERRGPIDELVLDGRHGEPIVGSRSKAGWIAMTRLESGEHLLLIGGNGFGRRVGWLFTYRREAPVGARFRFVAAYGRVPQPTARFDRDIGFVHNAAFVVGRDLALYVMTLGTPGNARDDVGLLRLYRLQRDPLATNVLALTMAREHRVERGPATTFRAGSTATVTQTGRLQVFCTESEVGVLGRLSLERITEAR